TSVVIPWWTLGASSGSTKTIRSEWLCMSMNPGQTILPAASTSRPGTPSGIRPTAAMVSPRIPTSAASPGAPDPSTTVPLRMMVSKFKAAPPLQLHQADDALPALFNPDPGAERGRQFRQLVQHLLAVGGLRQPRLAAPGPRLTQAQGDRVQLDGGHPAPGETTDGHHRLPEAGIRVESLGAAILMGRPQVVYRGRRGLGPQVVALVHLCGQPQHGFKHEHEVSERIEDRLAVVNLHGPQHVGAVAHEHVGPGVDPTPSRLDDEVRGFVGVAVAVLPFVGVQADDDQIGLAPRLGDPAGDLFQVAG